MSPCQSCDGTGTCKTQGCLTDKSTCGCLIPKNNDTNVCYENNAASPVNECQYCNIAAEGGYTSWTNHLSITCNDGDPCTRDDRCNTGACRGTDIRKTCDQHTVASNPCVSGTYCNGSQCLPTYHLPSHRCYANKDECDYPDLFCSGDSAECRYCDNKGQCASVLNETKPTSGVDPTDALISVFRSGSSDILSLVQGTNGNLYLMLTNDTEMRVKFEGFKVPCDNISIDWQLVDTADGDSTVYSSSGLIEISSEAIYVATVSKRFTLTNGGTYKIKAVARNVRGAATTKDSEEILVDTTSPLLGKIYDGRRPWPNLLSDIDFQSDNSTLSFHWDPTTVKDNESGIDTTSYRFAVGTSEGGSDVQDFVESATSEIASLTLSQNTRYYITVKVFNRAGLFAVQSSNGVTVDSTPPIAGTLTIVRNQTKLNYITIPSRHLEATLKGCIDLESGIHQISLTVCATSVSNPGDSACNSAGYTRYDCPDPADCLIIVTFPQSDRIFVNGVFQSGYAYRIDLIVQNGALLTSSVSSTEAVVDYDAPVPGSVLDGHLRDIDYQSANTSMNASWSGFEDEQSGLESCYLAIHKRHSSVSRNTSVISPFEMVPLVGNASVPNLRLEAGTSYVSLVRCFNKAGLFTDVFSDGVFIDPYPPIPTEIADIRFEDDVNDEHIDRDYQVKNSGVKSRWTVFPSASGLDVCVWFLGLKGNDSTVTEIVASQSVLPTSTTVSHSINMTLSIAYFSAVRCTSRAGLSTTVFSDGISVDNTFPVAGFVYDLCPDFCGFDTDVSSSPDGTALRFRWEGFRDAESGIDFYEWNYDQECSKAYILGAFERLSVSFTEFRSNHSLDHNVRYCVTVRGVNGAGLKSGNSTNGVLIDTSPPVSVLVKDGPNPSTDIDYQSSTDTISFTWSLVSDPESSIVSLETGVGTSPGEHDVVALVRSATVTSQSFSGLTLEDDHVYYSSVCATNGARIKTCFYSDGVLIDSTPPQRGVIVHGLVWPGHRYQADDRKLAAHWYGFTDLESTVEYFEWAVGTSPNGTDVRDYVNVGSNVTFEADLYLQNGKEYFVSVLGYNRAGLSVSGASDGVTVDITPPTPGEVTVTLTWPSTPYGVFVSWENFTDAESPVWYYKCAVGTTRCGAQARAYRNAGRNASALFFEIDFVSGLTYYASVVGRNRAGLSSKVCSDGALYDDSPPIGGSVRDGEATSDIDYTSLSSSMSFNWDKFEDDHSGILQCFAGIGTTNSTSDVQDFVAVSKAVTTHTFLSLQLHQGVKYYALVRCTNGKGLGTTVSSNGVTVDATPPSSGDVRTLSYQSSLTAIRAWWDIFTDSESLISGYNWSIGSEEPTSQNVLPFTDVKLSTSAVASSLNLTAHVTYFVTVRAFNLAGLSSTKSSEGLVVDTSPPESGIVLDGVSGDDVDWWRSDRGFGAHWTEFVDKESAISGYRWSIGTNGGGCQVLISSYVANNTTGYCQSCVFVPGVEYIVTVEATNGAGLKSEDFSDGFVVDLTEPNSGAISVLRWKSNRELQMHWTGASDDDSGIAECWLIGEFPNGTSVQTILANFESQTVTVDVMESTSASSVLVYVECTNKANMTSRTLSKSVDASPPESGSLRLLGYDSHSVIVEVRHFYDLESAIEKTELQFTVNSSNQTRILWPYFCSRYTFLSDQALYGRTIDIAARAVNFVGLWSSLVLRKFHLVEVEGINASDCCDINVKYNASVIDISWNWKNGMNNRSLERGYHYRLGIGTVAGGIQILPFTSVNSSRRFICTNCIVLQGLYCHVTLHASFDGFQTHLNVPSSPVLIDLTPPVAGKVIDGEDKDEDFYAVNETVRLAWCDYSDPESPIRQCSVSIVDSSSFAPIWTTSVTSNGKGSVAIDFSQNRWRESKRVFTAVECFTELGLSAHSRSDGFVLDATPPTKGRVSFSISGVQKTGLTDVMGAWTEFLDDESGIKEYFLSIVDNEERSLYEKSVLASTSFSTSLNLTAQMEYRLTVRATNGANMHSSSKSPWIIHDVTAPIGAHVYDGAGRYDIDYQFSIKGYSSSWGRMTDDETNIVDCIWFVGTTPGGSQFMAPQSVGQRTNGSCIHCILVPGMTLYSTVSCYNSAGYETSVSSDGLTIDTTSPMTGKVYDGRGRQDKAYQKEFSALDCSWDGFFDAESGIAKYSVCLGSSKGKCNIREKTGQTNSTEWHFASLHLKHRDSYYCSVWGTNRAGLSASSTSDGVLADLTAPLTGTVIDGTKSDLDCQHSNDSITARWYNFFDNESDIAFYEWGIGSKKGKDDLLPFASTGANQTASARLNVGVGAKRTLVFVTVRAQNGAGSTSYASSDGLRLLEPASALSAGCVSFGGG